MTYYLNYISKKIFVSNGENIILEVEQNSNWFGKSFYKFYANGVFILECSYSSSLFSTSIKIEFKNIRESIEFEKIDGKICLKYKEDYFNVKKTTSLLKLIKISNPAFKLLKNGIEVGRVFLLKRIAFGGGWLYKIEFDSEDDSTLFQVIFFILKDQQSVVH